MSEYSNLARGGRESASRYVRAVLDLLGERDPLDVLRETVEWCRDRTAGLTDEQLSRPEARGKWSAAGVLQHLADAEVVWSCRLRRTLAEERPHLQGWDQDLWAERLGYDVADAEEALAVLAALRPANVTLLSAASPDDLGRIAIHRERGEETLGRMSRLYAGHDLVHMRQLDRIVRAVGYPSRS